MKAKKLLLAVPMFAVLTSCTATFEFVYDIFKKARGHAEETREAAREALFDYKYTGTKTVYVYTAQRRRRYMYTQYPESP